jgi:hypothetical protein
VNRGKPQIIFGNQQLSPEKSNYFSLNAEYRTQVVAVSLTGYIDRINDMVVKHNIDVDATSLAMLRKEFPEMTDAEAAKLERYSLYQNSDKGDVKGFQTNVSANIFQGFNLSANYVYTYARTKSEEEWTTLERSIRHAATIAANYHHTWGKYRMNINLNGRLQSKTYYPDDEDAPGFGVWNLHTTHTIDCAKWAVIEPSIGIDNIFDKVDRRIDSPTRKYALYSPVHGKPRELHIEEARDAIDYQVWPEYRSSYDSTKPISQLVNCPHFVVHRVVVQVAQQVDFHCDSFVVVMCLWGEANINGIRIRQGETILVPASENVLYIFGNASFLTATIS